MTELPSAFAWATMHQGSTLSDMLALTSRLIRLNEPTLSSSGLR